MDFQLNTLDIIAKTDWDEKLRTATAERQAARLPKRERGSLFAWLKPTESAQRNPAKSRLRPRRS